MSSSSVSPQEFIEHWARAEANERANSQSFLIGLAQLLGVAVPSNSHYDGYSFEYPVKVPGGSSTNFIDLYRRGCFVLESKQFMGLKAEQSTLELVAQAAGGGREILMYLAELDSGHLFPHLQKEIQSRYLLQDRACPAHPMPATETQHTLTGQTNDRPQFVGCSRLVCDNNTLDSANGVRLFDCEMELSLVA